MDNEKKKAALDYTRRGWFVIPLCWPMADGRCGCPEKHDLEKDIGKAPIAGRAFQHLRLSEAAIEGWWTQYPDANVGILLEPSELFVLDIDTDEAWEEAQRLGDLGEGPFVWSGTGRHLYYAAPQGVAGRAVKKGTSRKIDVLASGYLVAPPSVHRGGTPYKFGIALADAALPVPPDWALRILQDRALVSAAPVALPDDLDPAIVDDLPVGPNIKELIRNGPTLHHASRSEAVFAVAMAMVEGGCEDPTIASVLLDPANAISAKPSEQGREWVASEIARARAKAGERPIEVTWEDDEPGDEAAPSDSACPPSLPGVVRQGLVKDYLDLMHPGVTEASPALHVANFLALVSSEMGRDFLLHSGDVVAANLYLLVVAPSAVGRKSTARALLDRYIRRQMPASRVAIRSGASTGEGVLTALGKDRDLSLHYDEFARLLTTASRAGNTLEDILNEAFTGTRLEKIVADQKNGICIEEGYSLSVVGCATPIGLRNKLSSHNMFGGLISRFLFVGAEATGDVPRTVPPDEELAKYIATTLSEKLEKWRHVRSLPVVFDFETEAGTRYDTWYREFRTKVRALPDQRLQSLADRTTTYAKKLAMIFTVLNCDPTPNPVLALPEVEAGIALADFAYASLIWATRGWSGPQSAFQERQSEVETKITAALRRHGGRGTTRQLSRWTSISYRDLNSTLGELRRGGVVHPEPVTWKNHQSGEQWVLTLQ